MKSNVRSRSRRRFGAAPTGNSSARQAVERSEPRNLVALGQQSTEEFRKKWQVPKLTQISHASYNANDPCEDRFIANNEVGMFGVFDGHGGHLCSSFLSEYAINVLLNHLAKCHIPSSNIEHNEEKSKSSEARSIKEKKTRPGKLSKLYDSESESGDSDVDILEKDFLGDEPLNVASKHQQKGNSKRSLRDKGDSTAANLASEVESCMKTAFLQLDDLFMGRMYSEYRDSVPIEAKSPYVAGSCGVVAFFHGGHITVANVGDSRAVLGQNTLFRTSRGRSSNKQHMALPLSFDQRASDPKEQDIVCARSPDPDPFPSARITANKVVPLDTPRVAGSLIVTRAFGDGFLKYHELSFMPYQQFVPYIDANPEVLTHEITPADECLIIASDGLWDVFSNEEAVLIAMQNRGAANVAQVLIDRALENIAKENELSIDDVRAIPLDVRRTVHDDITVVVIFLKELDHEHKPITGANLDLPLNPPIGSVRSGKKRASVSSLGPVITPVGGTTDSATPVAAPLKGRKPRSSKSQTAKSAVKKATTKKAKAGSKKSTRVSISSDDESESDKAWTGTKYGDNDDDDDDFESSLQPKTKAAAPKRPQRRATRR